MLNPILGNGTVSSANVSETKSQVVNPKSGRQSLTIVNTGTELVYLARNVDGDGLEAGKGIPLVANGTYEITLQNLYLGAIWAICAAGKTSTLAISEN